MRLAADELLYAVHVPRRFAQHRQYLRKVGTRRAMAISKVALAATALLEDGVVSEIRLAAASLAPFPTRLYQTEAALLGQPSRDDASSAAALLAEAQPIDDIRSTAEYRRRVAANLLEEFLLELSAGGPTAMNAVLDAWNKADEAAAFEAMIACCGARRWAAAMVALRPIGSVAELSEAADRVWSTMNEADWLEAFACHPRIGERKAGTRNGKIGCMVAAGAIFGRRRATESVWRNLPRAMRSTKSASALPILCAPPARAPKRCWRSSIAGWPAIARAELREAAEQQRQITQIRLGKWLVE